MPTYKAPVEDVSFLLNDVFQIDRYDNLPGFTDASADVREAILGEAAKPVEELEFRQRWYGPLLGNEGSPLRKGSGRDSAIRNTVKLIRKAPALSNENRPRHRREKGGCLRRNQVSSEHEDAARRSLHAAPWP